MLNKAGQFFIAHESRIILLIGLILVAGISFEGGYLKGKSAQNTNNPIIIERPLQGQDLSPGEGQAGTLETQKSSTKAVISRVESAMPSQNMPAGGRDCLIVGSKNSNKYHLASCASARQIKPENIICFSSVDDAVSKGYQPAASCFK